MSASTRGVAQPLVLARGVRRAVRSVTPTPTPSPTLTPTPSLTLTLTTTPSLTLTLTLSPALTLTLTPSPNPNPNQVRSVGSRSLFTAHDLALRRIFALWQSPPPPSEAAQPVAVAPYP